MSTRLFAAGLIPCAAVVLAACGPRVDLASEEAAIRDVAARWAAMDRERDAAGVAALFAEDASLVWDDRRPVRGRAAIEEHMATSYLENPSGEGDWGPDRIDVAASGDLAVEHGSWRNPGSEGRYMTVHRKLDGEWRVIADMSVDTPPDGGAPDWAVASLTAWYEAFNGRDAAAMGRLYAPNARTEEPTDAPRSSPPSGPTGPRATRRVGEPTTASASWGAWPPVGAVTSARTVRRARSPR